MNKNIKLTLQYVNVGPKTRMTAHGWVFNTIVLLGVVATIVGVIYQFFR